MQVPDSGWEQTHFTVFSEVFSRVKPKPLSIRPMLEMIAGAALNSATGLVVLGNENEHLKSLRIEDRMCALPVARQYVSIMLPTMVFAVVRNEKEPIPIDLVEEAVHLAPDIDLARRAAHELANTSPSYPLPTFMTVVPFLADLLGVPVDSIRSRGLSGPVDERQPPPDIGFAMVCTHALKHATDAMAQESQALRNLLAVHGTTPESLGASSQGTGTAPSPAATAYEQHARQATPPGAFFVTIELVIVGGLWWWVSAISSPWNWLFGLVAAAATAFALGHVNYYYGAKWRRLSFRLEHAWVPLAAGLANSHLSWDDALKVLIGIRYPAADRDALYAELVREWEATHLHVDWLRELMPSAPAHLSAEIEAIRAENGFNHFDVVEAIVRSDCSRSEYRSFMMDQIRRGYPQRGLGARDKAPSVGDTSLEGELSPAASPGGVAQDYASGGRVRHDQFGDGDVMAVDGEGPPTRLRRRALTRSAFCCVSATAPARRQAPSAAELFAKIGGVPVATAAAEASDAGKPASAVRPDAALSVPEPAAEFSDRQSVVVRRQAKAAPGDASRAHLLASIREYRTAVELDAQRPTWSLGLGSGAGGAHPGRPGRRAARPGARLVPDRVPGDSEEAAGGQPAVSQRRVRRQRRGRGGRAEVAGGQAARRREEGRGRVGACQWPSGARGVRGSGSRPWWRGLAPTPRCVWVGSSARDGGGRPPRLWLPCRRETSHPE